MTLTQTSASECGLCGRPWVRLACEHDGALREQVEFLGRYRVCQLAQVSPDLLVFHGTDRLGEGDVEIEVWKHEGGDDESERSEVYLQNCRRLMAMDHVSILTVVACGHDSSTGWPFAIRRREGVPLSTRDMDRAPSFRLVTHLFTQCARALAYAHARGIVHGALRPEDILVHNRRASIAGFGRLDLDQTMARHRGPYGAPERIDHVRGAMDVYSLGAIAFEVVSGEDFEGTEQAQAWATSSSAPTQLVRLIEQCVLRDPSERLSAADLAAELSKFARSSGAAPAFESPRGQRVDSYQIGELIGRGGTGSVYAGVDLETSQQIAIKVLRPEFAHQTAAIERLEREYRTSRLLNDEAAANYFGKGQLADGRPFVVMERLHGETLEARLKRGPLSIDEAVAITSAAARVLSEAHRMQVVHRDIKPANLFLTKEGVKVLDFGIAKVDRVDEPSLTQAGRFVGTPRYCAPEQFLGMGVDARADVYALASTLYEMVTGVCPYDAAPHLLAGLKVGAPPAPPSSVCASAHLLDALLLQSLEPDPDKRPATMDAFRQALTSIRPKRRWLRLLRRR